MRIVKGANERSELVLRRARLDLIGRGAALEFRHLYLGDSFNFDSFCFSLRDPPDLVRLEYPADSTSSFENKILSKRINSRHALADD